MVVVAEASAWLSGAVVGAAAVGVATALASLALALELAPAGAGDWWAAVGRAVGGAVVVTEEIETAARSIEPAEVCAVAKLASSASVESMAPCSVWVGGGQ